MCNPDPLATAPTAALTCGAHHVGLTVTNVEEAATFFTDALGFSRIGGRPAYPSIFVSDGAVMLTLWQANASDVVPFDRKHNIGLHHLALTVPTLSGLDDLATRLGNWKGVDLEFTPAPVGDKGNRHFMCNVPGGIRLELIAVGGS